MHDIIMIVITIIIIMTTVTTLKDQHITHAIRGKFREKHVQYDIEKIGTTVFRYTLNK